MLKKRNYFIFHSAIFQIFLLVLSSFAIASILSESFEARVDAADIPVFNIPAGGATSPVTAAPSAPVVDVAAHSATLGGPASVGATRFESGMIADNVWKADPSGGLFRDTTTNIVYKEGATGAEGTLGPGNTFVPAGTGTGGAGGTAGAAGAGGGNVAAPTPGLIDSIFGGQAFGGGAVGAMFSGLVWGAIAGGIAYFVAGMFGQTKQQAASIGMGVGGGTFVGASLYLYGQTTAIPGAAVAGQSPFFLFTPFGAVLSGIAVGAVIIIMTYKKEKKELVRFECQAWEPPTGGSHCDDCNDNPLMPCSEYRCRSLGQACQIVNPGTTEEKCVWVSKGDTSAPHMIPWDEALSPNGLKYYPDATISPPNRGFSIQDGSGGDGCLPAFSSLKFGIKTDEPAQCRVDYQAKNNYSQMQFLFGESNLFLEEHTQKLKVPNTQEGGDNIPEIGVDGTFKLWVRCIDANGNGEDSAAVAFSFCVDKGPDTTQPTIEGSSIDTGVPVQYNADSVPIEVYVNEPAECKWSRKDKAYTDMENVMSCGNESYQINADLNYVCSSPLTGIVNREDNWFYFRCEDNAGNVMATSYPLLLKGTEELTIQKTGPTGEFTGSTTVIPVTLEVETAHGAANGNATCSFSNSASGRFIVMDNTGNGYTHNQTLDLGAAVHTYYFRCIDAGGNLATGNTTFNVTIDKTKPLVTRVFKDGNVLKVVTSEEAKCYYSNTNCDYNLEDGLVMLYEDATKRNVHTAEWNAAVTYYVKCEDFQGNQPSPDDCQIVAKASEL